MTVLGPDRWQWLWISMAFATVAALAYWLVAHQARAVQRRALAREQPPAHAVEPEAPRSFDPWTALLAILDTPWVIQPLRLLYAVGLPAAALFWQHSLSMRGLGLQGLPTDVVGLSEVGMVAQGALPGGPEALGNTWAGWAHDFGAFAGVLAVMGLAILVGDRAARRGATPLPPRHHGPGAALRDAVYYQVHWAFYREPFVVGWGIPLGSWMGALPVLVETLISPVFWQNWHTGDARFVRRVLIRCGLFVAGTQLYLLTQNLWLIIALDAIVGWLALPDSRPGLLPMPVSTPLQASQNPSA